MRPMVHSRKHMPQYTQSEVGLNSTVNQLFITAVQDATETLATNVHVGDTIKAVYVEIWILGNTSQPATITAMIEKVPSGGSPATNTEMGQLHTYHNKHNILETHQGFIGDANTNPIPVYRGWIKIPKGKQRFALGERMYLNIRSITSVVEFCGQIIFKSYN